LQLKTEQQVFMNIHEYQAKALLAKFAVPLLKGGVAYTKD
jgi:succinyl-CoA synthetase beta subunit